MPTLILEAPGRIAIAPDTDPGLPGPGQARVRVHRVGVCGTDYHAYAGKQPMFAFPRILGHEVGVVVESIGAGVTNVAPGDRCAVEPYLACGRCVACRRGKTNCCTAISVLGVHADGAWRPAFILPADHLHPSTTLDCEVLALVETLAIGAHAVARSGATTGERVLVIGTGPIGLSTIPFLQVAGAQVAVMDMSAERLAFAREQFSVTATLQPGATNDETRERIVATCGGEAPTVVIDATGNAASMNAAVTYAAHGGTLVFVGLHQGDVVFKDLDFHRRELTMMGSRNALPEDFRRIIALLEAGRIDTRPWITHRCQAVDLPALLPEWGRPEARCLKGMVSFA